MNGLRELIHAALLTRYAVRWFAASGPWRTSGDWWGKDVWARDEWDVAVTVPPRRKVRCFVASIEILQSEEWFVAGVYD